MKVKGKGMSDEEKYLKPIYREPLVDDTGAPMPDEVVAELSLKLMRAFWDEFDSFDGEYLITKDGKTEGFEALARVALAHVEERERKAQIDKEPAKMDDLYPEEPQ